MPMGIDFLVAASMAGPGLLGGLAILIEPVLNVLLLLPFDQSGWAT